MKVVVAGGTGFLGRHISARLLQAGHQVDVLSRDPDKRSRVPQLEGIGGRRGDVTEPASLRGVLDGADAVVGAVQFPNHPIELPRKGLTYERYDRRGTEHLVAEAQRAGLTHFFYLSGAGADPASDKTWYRAKGWAEEAVITSGLRFGILRPSWAYGPEDRALNRLEKISRFSPVVPRIGVQAQTIQPVYVVDVARAVQAVFADESAWNEIYEIGSPEVMTMQEVIATMLDVTGRRRLILPVPAPLVKAATAPLLALPRPLMTPHGVDFAIQNGLVDISKLRARLGLTPRSLRDGLKEYMS